MARTTTNLFADRFPRDPSRIQLPVHADPGASTVHAITHARRSAGNWHIAHEYEVIVWQSAGGFVAEMRSRLVQVRGSQTNPQGAPWQSQSVFTTLAEAQRHAAAILENPEQSGAINRPSSAYSYDHVVPSWSGSRGQSETRTVLSRYERPQDANDTSLGTAIVTGLSKLMGGNKAKGSAGIAERAEAVAAGQATLPTDVSAGEVVRHLWGRNEPNARSAILDFARTAPLTYGAWSHWKWLYKAAEAAHDLDLLSTFLARLDTTPLSAPAGFSWLEQPPTPATIGYMKRRGRRMLRQLARTNPTQYVETASDLLIAAGHDRRELDLKAQWLTLDILYGTSGRYAQGGHGRGAYVRRRARPSLSDPEELAPAAWSARLDLLLRLYAGEHLAWPIQEWAAAALLRRGIALPALSEPTLVRFLEGASPLLIRIASRQAGAQIESGSLPGPHLTALTILYSHGGLRRRLTDRLLAAPPLPHWDEQFVANFAPLVAAPPAGKPIPQRFKDAAVLLAQRYSDRIPGDHLRGLIPVFLSCERLDLLRTIEPAISRLAIREIPDLLSDCAHLSLAARSALLDLLIRRLQGQRLSYHPVCDLVLHANAWVREAAWHILAADDALDALAPSALWSVLVAPYTPEATLASAIGSVDALRLIPSPEIFTRIAELIKTKPTLLATMSPEAFALLTQRLPLDALLSLIGNVEESLWLGLRDRLLAELRADGRLPALWRAVWSGLDDPTQRRLLEDPTVTATFVEVADPTFLDLTQPALAPLLLAWMDSRPDLFDRGAPPLLQAATHKIPAVRSWALARIDAVGLTTPFALRLLESALPEPMALGRRFFDAVPHGDPHELDYALALCDSPNRAVQVYGQEYVAARRATLPADELTRRLAEHPDPAMQEVVARTLLAQPALAAEVAHFDAGVLRARDRGRRAKELVKQRLSHAAPLAMDTATLLELARSRTPRDAEWALQQLARLAASGIQIEGLDIAGAWEDTEG